MIGPALLVIVSWAFWVALGYLFPRRWIFLAAPLFVVGIHLLGWGSPGWDDDPVGMMLLSILTLLALTGVGVLLAWFTGRTDR